MSKNAPADDPPATHFIADLHLLGDDTPTAKRLAGYLAGPARAAAALYVLGDLFEVWVGDDGSIPVYRRTLDAFSQLVAAGVPVYFMRGNRDFAVGSMFERASGMQIVSDPLVINCDGAPTLLSHGDAFCTDDTAHQAFRARYTDARWRARMSRLPLWLRRWLAIYARRKSTAGKGRKPEHVMDVNPGSVAQCVSAHGVGRLIHGHTHRPADHALIVAGRPASRHVLSDWHEDRAQILKVGRSGVRRQNLDSAGQWI